MILLLRAAQAPMGSIEPHAVGLELAPAELGVLAEVSQRRPVIPHCEDLSRQTRVTPRSVARNGETCELTTLHNGRNGEKHGLYLASSTPPFFKSIATAL